MAPVCTHCGFVNPEGMRFCGNCGARLPEEAGLPALGVQTLDKPAPPSLADFTPESLGVLVGADLLERFRKAGLEARGQRRNVTVLFADLAGYTQLSSR